MSRRIIIKGGIDCRLSNLVEEVVSEMQSEGCKGLRYDAAAGQFVYDGLDDHYKEGTVKKAETCYGVKLQTHHTEKVKEATQKEGYDVVEEETTETGEIQLVLMKRVYD